MPHEAARRERVGILIDALHDVARQPDGLATLANGAHRVRLCVAPQVQGHTVAHLRDVGTNVHAEPLSRVD